MKKHFGDGFIHLRNRTAYSLARGAIPVSKLIALAQTHKMPAVAISDVDYMFGVLEFATQAAEHGIQPLVGCDFAVCIAAGASLTKQQQNNTNFEQRQPNDLYHGRLLAFATSAQGYQNLMAISSHAASKSLQLQEDAPSEPYGKPVLYLEDLAPLSKDLLVLDSGWMGPAGQAILKNQPQHAKIITERLSAIYSGYYYIELMRTERKQEKATEQTLIDLAYELNLPLIASNDCHYPDHSFWNAHKVLVAINASPNIDGHEGVYETGQHFFKSAQDMRTTFSDIPEACDNSLHIAQRIAFMPTPCEPLLPKINHLSTKTTTNEVVDVDTKDSQNTKITDHFNIKTLTKAGDILKEQALAGLAVRLKIIADASDHDLYQKDDYYKRLQHELVIIDDMGFSDYFLIVADFIAWAKKQHIPVGPGRGSGAGSLVAWSLTITDINPLKFDLLFERFLNPERISMPDFDIDFCQEQRERVIQYVQQKYGSERVAQIITFGTLQARAVLRDVGRVMGLAWSQVDKLCRLIPNNPSAPVTLKQAIEQEPALREQINSEAENQKLVDIACQLEGLYRHASTHAAGVVIADRPLQELVPLYRDPRSNILATQFNMKWVEKAGLVKFDFLGLKTLSILALIQTFIQKRSDHPTIDFSNLPLDDQNSFTLMQNANTVGVFQLESSGMREVLQQLRPDCFDDIVAIVALYRPGPMDNIPAFIKRKHGHEKPEYLHPLLEPILSKTHGIAIYQEQVIQMARTLAGFTLGSADLLRNAMGKKIKSEMERQRRLFIEGAKKLHQIEGPLANKIFDQMAAFAGYGFNKSHAVCYAMIAYQTAWAKANYPAEFFAASMSFELNNTDKITSFLRDMNTNKIKWKPPDINQSGVNFEITYGSSTNDHDLEPCVQYGLSAIRNVGYSAMEQCIDLRIETGPFQNIFDFVERIPANLINKRALENLARSGAFDVLNPNRRQLFLSAQLLLQYGNDIQNDRATGQSNLFGDSKTFEIRPQLPACDDWPLEAKLTGEFEACGCYLSDHPLSIYQTQLSQLKIVQCSDIADKSGTIRMAGSLTSKRIINAKHGQVALLQMSDASGSFEVTVYDRLLQQIRPLLETSELLLMDIAIDSSSQRETPRLLVHNIVSLHEKLRGENATGLQIVVTTQQPLEVIHRLFKEHAKQGHERVEFCLKQTNIGNIRVKLPNSYYISAQLQKALRSIPGVHSLNKL